MKNYVVKLRAEDSLNVYASSEEEAMKIAEKQMRELEMTSEWRAYRAERTYAEVGETK